MSTPEYNLEDDQLLRHCRVSRAQASGPGGQHVNRTRSAVTITHLPTAIQAQAQDHRDARLNQREALRRLRLRLACQGRGASDQEWLRPFRQGRRLQASSSNPRFYLLAACCLDALEQSEGQLAEAAELLACSATQLRKVLHLHKEVWAAAQQLVTTHGRAPLRSP